MACLIFLSLALIAETSGKFISLEATNVTDLQTVSNSSDEIAHNLHLFFSSFGNETFAARSDPEDVDVSVLVDAANSTKTDANETAPVPVNVAIPNDFSASSNVSIDVIIDASEVNVTDVSSDGFSIALVQANDTALADNLEKNSNESNVVDGTEEDVPIPAKTCERGERPAVDICVLSKFTRDFVGNLVSPPCEEDRHCPMNAICDQTQLLCQCVNGQALSETLCEASALGGRCDNYDERPEEEINVVCKSDWYPCVGGICSCAPGQFLKDSGCIPMLSLDNDCVLGGIPCRGEGVECLAANGDPCGENATCTCSCTPGLQKNADTKICEKPAVKPTVDTSKDKRAQEESTTTTTPKSTAKITPKPTSLNNSATGLTIFVTSCVLCSFALSFIL